MDSSRSGPTLSPSILAPTAPSLLARNPSNEEVDELSAPHSYRDAWLLPLPPTTPTEVYGTSRHGAPHSHGGAWLLPLPRTTPTEVYGAMVHPASTEVHGTSHHLPLSIADESIKMGEGPEEVEDDISTNHPNSSFLCIYQTSYVQFPENMFQLLSRCDV